MRFAKACIGLENAISHLTDVIQIQNTSVIKSNRTISWMGRTPGIIKGVYYPLEYQFLLDHQQYSLLLSDGSFFQFYYSFDVNDELKKACLTYYPRPISTRDTADELLEAAEEAFERDDEQLYDHLYNWTELLEIKQKSPSNTSHVRFDYDRDVTSHCQSHIQFSGVQELRLSADFFPLPLAFVQLCEAMLPGANALNEQKLNFEKKNFLVLRRPSHLISLGCLSDVS